MKQYYKLIFVTEMRFFTDLNGNFYADSSFNICSLQRYLNYFKSMTVIARVENIKSQALSSDNFTLINHPNINFSPLPYYIGFIEFVFHRRNLIRKIESILSNANEFKIIIRSPGPIGYYASRFLSKTNRGYGVEVVGDPEEVFTSANFNRCIAFVLKEISVHQLKFTIEHSNSTMYVTQHTLQKKYPFPDSNPSYSASNVVIEDNHFVESSKNHSYKHCYNLVCVGSLAQLYKGPDIMIKALKIIQDRSLNIQVKLTWIGDGVYRKKMDLMAKNLKLSDSITFVGSLPFNQVQDVMLNSDLLIHPSRTEGLPRVIIEGMSLGLPVIATNVGGIPELISSECLVERDNYHRLSDKIIELLTHPDIYNAQANLNLEKARAYKFSALERQRKYFFQSLP